MAQFIGTQVLCFLIAVASGVVLLYTRTHNPASDETLHKLYLFQFIGTQVLCFLIAVAGAAVLLDYSTYESKIQPLIRDHMRSLISDSHNEHSSLVLRMVQESVSIAIQQFSRYLQNCVIYISEHT